MFISVSDSRDWSQYEFVIIGSGFAGQFLSEALSKRGKILLIEAGGLNDPLALGNGYYEMESGGIAVPKLGMRLSAFGGTSNHWTGQCHPFSKSIFHDRPGIPGWPIRYEDYAAHLPEAQAWLDLPAFYPPGTDGSLGGGLYADEPDLQALRFLTPNPLRYLGDSITRQRYANYRDVDVLVDTRVVDLVLDDVGAAVDRVEIIHRPSRQRLSIPARNIILCAGGIENARLMLWAGRRYAEGNPLTGGPNALTGQFYTEHPVYFPVDIYFDGRVDLSNGLLHGADECFEHSMWALSDAMLERYELLRFGLLIRDTWKVARDSMEVADLDADFLASVGFLNAARPAFKFEQTPHSGSRVVLSDELDDDGVAVSRLNWQILPGDFANYRRGTLAMCEVLTRRGFARARLREPYLQEDWSAIQAYRSAHPTGTTRMARTSKEGVVDRNSRVFGLRNMYVAGASVFPHGDFLNPTINFLALAARLAHVLSARLSPAYAHFRFGTGRAENERLGDGWSHPEELGIWTEGHRSIVRLPRGGAGSITFYGHAFRKVEVALTIDGTERYRGPATGLMGLTVPLSGEAMIIDVVFDCASLLSPRDFGESDDARLLGFFLERIELN